MRDQEAEIEREGVRNPTLSVSMEGAFVSGSTLQLIAAQTEHVDVLAAVLMRLPYNWQAEQRYDMDMPCLKPVLTGSFCNCFVFRDPSKTNFLSNLSGSGRSSPQRRASCRLLRHGDGEDEL